MAQGYAVGFLSAVPRCHATAALDVSGRGGCVLCHVKGCGRTFAGLALAVTSCLAIADRTLLVLAQILGSLNETFAMESTHS